MTAARFITVFILADKIEEAISLFRDSILPDVQTQAGFQGARMLLDRATGKGVLVTLWTNESAMLATESNGHLQQQLAKFGNLFTAPPIRERYELVINI